MAVNVLDKEMGVMVLNAFFNNISVISWQSVLLVEKTGVPGENVIAEKVASLLKTDVLICRTGGIIYLYQNGTNLYHESLHRRNV
jgi:hypothetical protein